MALRNCSINDGGELFGDNTRLLDGTIAEHGFAALSEFDDQKDGKIDRSDAVFERLRIFQDLNQNGEVDDGELFGLAEKKIASLNLTYEESWFVDKFGNIHRQLGTYVTDSGEERTMTDVVFTLDLADTTTEMLEVPADIAALPDAVGYGTTYSLHQAMVRDQSGRLQELVERYVASDDRQERQALVENILYLWTGEEEGTGEGFAKKIHVLDSFFGESLGSAWLRATERFDQLVDMVTNQLSRQSHLKKLFNNITYSYNEDADTWVGRYDNVVPVLARLLEGGTRDNRQLVQEFTQCIRGINPYNDLNGAAFRTEVARYIDENAAFATYSTEVQGLLVSLAAGATDLDDLMTGDGLLYGFAGNDRITGRQGNDTLKGGLGDDILRGGAGDDILIGGIGNDELEGGSGNDIYRLAKGFGHDSITNYDTDTGRFDCIVFTDDTTADDLTFSRHGETLVITVAGSDDQLRIENHFYLDAGGGYAVDQIRFADGSSLAIGSSSFEVLNSVVNTITEEADQLHGSLADDSIDGLGGDDSIYGKGGNDTLIGGAGDDVLSGQDGSDTLEGGAGDDSLSGGSGDDVLSGGAGDDELRGVAGVNTLTGGSGNDHLVGGSGVDTFRYGLGDGRDSISNRNDSGEGSDILELTGGIGVDDVALRREYNNLLLRISDGGEIWIENFFLNESPSLSEIRFADGSGTVWTQERIFELVRQGTAAGDFLYGSGGADVFHGLEGDDRIDGYSGDDQIHGDEGNDFLYGSGGSDELLGGAGNDRLSGGTGSDTLIGGAGVDILAGDEGDDIYLYSQGFGQDVIYNQAFHGERDAIVFDAGFTTEQIVAERRANNLVLSVAGSEDSITVANYFLGIDVQQWYLVDEIRFADGTVWRADDIKQLTVRQTAGDDIIYGYQEDNVFDGLAGDDEIHGGGGADHLTGNTGDDYLYGDTGDDTLLGNSGADVLYGGAGDDILEGGAGNDILSGQGGNNLFRFAVGFGNDNIIGNYYLPTETETIHFAAGITASQFSVQRKGRDLLLQSTISDDSLRIEKFFHPGNIRAAGTPFVFEFADGSHLEFDSLVNQSLLTTEGDDYLFGYEEDNTLAGGAGNDTIWGNGGADILSGGSGSDFLEGGAGDDQLAGDEDDDRLLGGTGNDLLAGGAGADNLSGGAGDDTLTGGPGDDSLYGGAGNDILVGGAGDDYLTGGIGDDVYRYSTGFGNDHIDNFYNANTDAFDVILFDETISPEDVRALREQNNLKLLVTGTGDQITVNNYFHSHARGNYIVNEIQFADGTVWNIPTVKELVLQATADADELHGYEMDDVIDGLAGADILFGHEGADALAGGVGNDTLYGGLGRDTLVGGAGDDSLRGGRGSDNLQGGEGNDHLDGGLGSDTLFGGAGDDSLQGGEGNDTLAGGLGSDSLFGGDGNDSLQGGEDNDILHGEADHDTLAGDAGDDTLYGGLGSDTLFGGAGDDSLQGGEGNDTLAGGLGSDVLFGGVGDDSLQGGRGNDTLVGGSGSDTYLFALGDGQDVINNIDSSDGIDILALQAGISPEDVRIRRVANDMVVLVGDGADRVTVTNCFYNEGDSAYAVDRVVFADGTSWDLAALKARAILGSEQDDRLLGFAESDELQGLGGSDELFGAGGDDILSGGAGADSLDGGTGNDLLHGDSGDDLLDGGSDDDTLSGGTGNDSLDGGLGNDTYRFSVGDGQDVISNHDTASGRFDVLEFGDGITEDTVRAQRVDNDLCLHVGEDGEGVVVAGFFTGDGHGGYAIDEVRFSDGTSWDIDRIKELVLLGTASADLLKGFADADTLKGFAGDDDIDGAGGDDAIYGGTGSDLLKGGTGSDSYYFSAGDGQDTMNNYDPSSGSHDRIVFAEGIAEDDVLVKRSGQDLHLVVGNGDDRIVVSNFFENDGLGAYGLDEVRFASGTSWDLDQLKKFAVLGGAGDDLLVGYASGDLMKGFAGNDTIQGLAGDDVIYGGDGVDSVKGGTGADSIFGGSGADILSGDAGADTMTAGEGDDTVDGGAGADSIFGGLGNDALRGGADADRIEGGDGIDSIHGDGGDDLLYGNAGDDSLSGGLGHDTMYGNEGDDTLAGNEGSDILYGGDGADSLQGNDANDVLYGGTGDDTLAGGSGYDRLDGGSGADHMAGGHGGDIYVVDSIADTVVELAGEGYDSVESSLDISLMENVERAVLTGAADINATGNALDNELLGNAGSNILDGGAGADQMAGGAGDDSYYTDLAPYIDGDFGDTIAESADAGIDTEIRSYEGAWLLADNVENLILAGSIYRGNGNELDNILTGNDAANNLWGREGNDTLYGLGGDDQLIGDIGEDHLEGGDGDDLLNGGAGDDSLYGGNGNDQLNGGSGVNYLRGGAGDDGYIYGSDGGVYEIDAGDGGADWLLFTDDLTRDRLSFLRVENDLVVQVDGDASRQVTVKNWFLGEQYQLNLIQPAGMSGISASSINAMFPPANAEADTIAVPSEGFEPVYGTLADDEQLIGSGANEILRGFQGDDNLFALAGDDWLLGGSGDDYLDGGAGNDTLHAGAGDDRYVFKPGYGEETIDNSGGGLDRLIFADGLTGDKLVFSQSGDDLVIRVSDSTDRVTVKNWFLGGDWQIDYIHPDGAYGIPAAQIADLLSEPDFAAVITGTEADDQLAGTADRDQINGLAGADQLSGLAGNDELNGGAGNDILDGGAGDDLQYGNAGNDQLGGDAGDDLLDGGAGDDSYVYRPGSGSDTISNTGGGTDWLIFTDDITADRLNYLREDDNLIVRVDGDAASQVTVQDWFKGEEYQLGFIQPAGQDAISAAEINALFVDPDPSPGVSLEVPDESVFDLVNTGTPAGEQVVGSNGKDLLKGLEGNDQLFAFAGDDWLLGGDGDDYFDGGAGNDTMLGGAGNDQLGGDAGNDVLAAGIGDDTYVYRPGSGSDIIVNTGGGTDWLIFTDDITADRLGYFRSGDDLRVKIDGSSENMVTIQDWFKGGTNEVAYIQPAGGYGIPAAQINTMVQDEPEAAPAAAKAGGVLNDTAAALGFTSTVEDSDYASYRRNIGLGLDNSDFGVSSDLSDLAEIEETVNRELLAS